MSDRAALALRLAGIVAAAWFVIGGRSSAKDVLVAYALAFCSEAVLVYVSRPFGLRIGLRFTWSMALAAAAAGLAVALWSGWQNAIVLVAGAALILRLVQAFVYHRPGGLTGSGMALAGLLVETFTLSYLQKASSTLG